MSNLLLSPDDYEKTTGQKYLLTDFINPEWDKCSTCGEMAFIPHKHTECYDCLNIWYRNNPPPPDGRYKKIPIPQELRMRVFERDGFVCRNCGSTTKLQVDHIHPESRGGETVLENLQILCKSCNLKKGTKLPNEWEATKHE